MDTLQDFANIKYELMQANPVECASGCGKLIFDNHIRIAYYKDGYIWVSLNFAKKATIEETVVVLSHEMAHSIGITDEKEADRIGIKMAVKAGYKESKLVKIAKRIRNNIWNILF